MMSDEIIAICTKGIALPDFNGKKMPIIVPDHLEWDAGVIITKKQRKLFVFVVSARPEESYIRNMENEFTKSEFSCIMIIGSNEEEIRNSGERFWIYNHAGLKPVAINHSPPQNDENKSSIVSRLSGGDISPKDSIELEQLAKSIMGDISEKWMKTSLLLLSMKTPLEACMTHEGMKTCTLILKRFPHNPQLTTA